MYGVCTMGMTAVLDDNGTWKLTEVYEDLRKNIRHNFFYYKQKVHNQ
jgi:hypothetical protein